jgi:hypothetical protein
MSELHWTGAALLLAIALLGDRAPRARREPRRPAPVPLYLDPRWSNVSPTERRVS